MSLTISARACSAHTSYHVFSEGVTGNRPKFFLPGTATPTTPTRVLYVHSEYSATKPSHKLARFSHPTPAFPTLSINPECATSKAPRKRAKFCRAPPPTRTRAQKNVSSNTNAVSSNTNTLSSPHHQSKPTRLLSRLLRRSTHYLNTASIGPVFRHKQELEYEQRGREQDVLYRAKKDPQSDAHHYTLSLAQVSPRKPSIPISDGTLALKSGSDIACSRVRGSSLPMLLGLSGVVGGVVQWVPKVFGSMVSWGERGRTGVQPQADADVYDTDVDSVVCVDSDADMKMDSDESDDEEGGGWRDENDMPF